MKMEIYAVRDSAVAGYMRPFFVQTRAVAMRSIVDALGDPETTLSRFPSHYSLWYLGTFDDQSGCIESIPPEHICNLIDLVPADTPEPEVH